AMLARDSRRYDEAAALYRRGMRESPSVQLILSFAAMEKNRRRNTEARRIYEDGIRLFPDIAKLREDAGVLAASQRDYQRAIVHLEEALAICRRTDQGGEKGVLLGLARTHYQIGSPSSLKESIRYYEQAQTLFGRGATRLPEADLLRLNLTRIRTQHHRGNLTYGFLSDAGFQVIKATLLDRVTDVRGQGNRREIRDS
ncbi:MAG TPA: hypothetical protein VJY15_17375, partial [Candidatus Acidoferrum sp.]|nr:hypothetical protein [Candidatus Acidoferrum sp.]